IGLSTDRSILGTFAHRLSGVVAIIVGVGTFLVVTSFQAGNSAGTGAASELLLGGNPDWYVIGLTIMALIFVWIPKFYPAPEMLMDVLILVMLVAMTTTAVISKPELNRILEGLVPTI